MCQEIRTRQLLPLWPPEERARAEGRKQRKEGGDGKGSIKIPSFSSFSTLLNAAREISLERPSRVLDTVLTPYVLAHAEYPLDAGEPKDPGTLSP